MKLGDTFRASISTAGVDQNRHLWIVLSDPVSYADQVITAFITSFQKRRDQTCILEAGEHPFVVHRSVVAYGVAEIRRHADLLTLLATGRIVQGVSVEQQLVEKIRMLLPYSPHVSSGILKMAQEQGFDRRLALEL